MLKFDPKAFLDILKEEAVEFGLEFQIFFTAIRVELNHHRPDKVRCLRLAQLVGLEVSLKKETLEHIDGCWFCSTLIKSSWIKSTSSEDRNETCEYVMNVCNITPEHFEAKLADDSAAEAGDPHLNYTELVCFNSISQDRRNHRALCKQCDLFMIIFETMPLPDL